MTEFFYDKLDNCIINTKQLYEFFNNYFSDSYVSFEEYLNYNYPQIIWIENYTKE